MWRKNKLKGWLRKFKIDMEIEEYGEKKEGKVIDAKSEPFQPHTLLKHAEEATMNRMSRVESNVRRPDDSLHVSRRQYIYIYI
jgi:hypothetical protein